MSKPVFWPQKTPPRSPRLCDPLHLINLPGPNYSNNARQGVRYPEGCCLGVARGRPSSALSTAALWAKVRRRAPARPVRVYTMVSGQ